MKTSAREADLTAAEIDAQKLGISSTPSFTPDLVPGVLPPALRRHLQRALPRVPDADGDALGPRGDPGALRQPRAPAAAGPHGRAAADPRPRSLLLLEGREHLARRRLMLPPFHGERMRAYESTVREVVAREVETWPEGEPFAIHPRMQAVTLEVILRAVFGVTDDSAAARLAERLGGLLADTASVGLQFGVLLSRRFWAPDPLARLQALRREIDALLDAEIAERRADPREDILSLLVAARFEDGEPMDDAEIRDQLMTLLLAGHETTATGLAWTFDLLLRHPPCSSGSWPRSTPATTRTCAPWSPSRCGCARWSRSPGGGSSCELRVDGHVLPPGPT